VLNEQRLLSFIPGDIDKSTGKHGSLTTILSVWNSMIGSGMLTIPWAFS